MLTVPQAPEALNPVRLRRSAVAALARRPAAAAAAQDNRYKRRRNDSVHTAVARVRISARMRMSSQAPRAGIPLPPPDAMTPRVTRARPLPLAGRHTLSSRGRHPPDDPGCLPSGPSRTASLPVESAPAFGYDSTAPGGVPEWLKGADCKSVGAAYPGSNPGSPTKPG